MTEPFLALIIKWYLCQKLDTTSQTTGKRFIDRLNDLKAIAVDEKIPIFIRTAIDKQTIDGFKKLRMKVPAKVILDKRRRPKTPPRRPGRPKKQVNPNQQTLL